MKVDPASVTVRSSGAAVFALGEDSYGPVWHLAGSRDFALSPAGGEISGAAAPAGAVRASDTLNR